MNEQNLISEAHKLTPEDRSKGGKRGAASRRAHRTFATVLRQMLASDLPACAARAKLEELGMDTSWLDAVNMAQLERATKGDTDAVRFVRDTIGERPREGLDLGIEDKSVADLDTSRMTDAQLQAIIARREAAGED